MNELDTLINEPPTLEEWQRAEAVVNPQSSFVLWAIKTQFCTRKSDFHHHFSNQLRIDSLLHKLELQGFVQPDGADYALTASGEEVVASLGEPEISKYADLKRAAVSVAHRFDAADVTKLDIIDDPDSNEYILVERPFIEQLEGLGWSFLKGDKFVPELTARESFRDVLLLHRLRAALRRINLDEHNHEWLDDVRINQAMTELQRLDGYKLMERNEVATRLITRGTDVEGTPERDGGRPRRIQFINFEHPERNDFLAVNNFRVDAPGSQRHIVADLVLFVNGIPLVVIECKSPALTNPTEEAITQLLRYSNQRIRTTGRTVVETETAEGAEDLFYYNQLLVVSCFFEASAGSISASYEHFLEWKDTYPLLPSEVAEKLGVTRLSSQQTLAAGMLRPEHLLDIVRNFIIFQETGGKRIKLIPRYTQFRAVRKAIDRLKNGKTRLEDGEQDERGGIIWHTQGSGKSLTMVYLIRKMRRIEQLQNFKIVIVTDRRDLQTQLGDTAVLTGEKPIVRYNIPALKNELREDSPDIVFAMIQKMRPENEDASREDEELDEEPDSENLGVLNTSTSILLLIDEAHRSHASTLHAALMRALPNAAKIGFTGTPILMGNRKHTEQIFGRFLDSYTIKQSEIDKATVPILYEGRHVEGEIVDKQSLDFYFDTEFRDRSPEERAAIKRRYVNQPEVAMALKLVAAKADDMLRHYVNVVLPEGLKAQVVSTNREAAVRYQQAFVHAKENLLAELRAVDLALLKETNENRHSADDKTKFLIRAYQHLPTIERLEFAAVISDSNDDPANYHRWNNPEAHQTIIARFKRDLMNEDPAKQDNLAFLCVASMLITGFDAPVEGVLYLDRNMKTHELLQTIARVNRPFPNKTHGLVVDYYGVAQNLKEALAVYTAEDIAGALSSIRDELPLLVDRHRRVRAVFESREIRISDVQLCVELLADAEIRADFVLKLKKFLSSLNIVLPRPEALPFIADAKQLGMINRVAGRLYRDEEMNLIGVGEKVRQLIDEFVEAKGIRLKIPPVSITDPDFERNIDVGRSDRSKASEMEYAARFHITKHYEEDPIYYRKLSERLQEIIQQFAENWAARAEALRILTRDIARGRAPNEFGLDVNLEARFYDIIIEEASKEGELSYDRRAGIATLTGELVTLIRQHLRHVDFWRNSFNREVLQKEVAVALDNDRVIPLARCEAVADRVVELAYQLSTHLKQ